MVAARILLDNGVEPILQMTCRDRNRLALQGDLLGALAFGVHNLLVVTGDDPKAGDQPDAKPVFDLDSTRLLALAHRLASERRLASDATVKGPTALYLGAAAVPSTWRPEKPSGGRRLPAAEVPDEVFAG